MLAHPLIVQHRRPQAAYHPAKIFVLIANDWSCKLFGFFFVIVVFFFILEPKQLQLTQMEKRTEINKLMTNQSTKNKQITKSSINWDVIMFTYK